MTNEITDVVELVQVRHKDPEFLKTAILLGVERVIKYLFNLEPLISTEEMDVLCSQLESMITKAEIDYEIRQRV